jgi:hypothetical protein
MHSTDNLEDGYMGSGKRLWNSINKHGKENHVCEILEFLPDRSSLKTREKEIVNVELINEDLCMNLQLGGGGGISSNKHLLSLREGSKIWLKNKWNDVIYSESIKKQLYINMKRAHANGNVKYDTFTGKSHSEETKLKIGAANSIKQKGSNNSQYGKCWITNDIESKKINKGDIMPEGWRLGRKI